MVDLNQYINVNDRLPYLDRLTQLPNIIKKIRLDFDKALQQQGRVLAIEKQLASLTRTQTERIPKP